MMKFLKNKKQNKGFTLVEILLVVGFIALAGIGIYTIYSKVQVSNQANTESRNLDTLRAGVKSLYGGRPNFNGVTATIANNARVTPETMRTVGSAALITNSFGGTVLIAATPLNAIPDAGFRITYPQVPSSVCAKLVTSVGVQFDQVTVNGVIVKTFAVNAPIDVALTTTNCNAVDTPTILFDSN